MQSIYTGKIDYFDSTNKNIVEAAKASSILPLIMPPVYIDGVPYVDGGVRDVVPLRPLTDKHDLGELVIIITHPEKLSVGDFNIGHLDQYINRTKNITVNEIIKGDLDNIKKFSQNHPFNVKKTMHYRIIRPETELKFTLDKFTQQDLRDLMDLGYETAKKSLWS